MQIATCFFLIQHIATLIYLGYFFILLLSLFLLSCGFSCFVFLPSHLLLCLCYLIPVLLEWFPYVFKPLVITGFGRQDTIAWWVENHVRKLSIFNFALLLNRKIFRASISCIRVVMDLVNRRQMIVSRVVWYPFKLCKHWEINPWVIIEGIWKDFLLGFVLF